MKYFKFKINYCKFLSIFNPSANLLIPLSSILFDLLIDSKINYSKFKFSYYKFVSNFNPSANLLIPSSPISLDLFNLWLITLL